MTDEPLKPRRPRKPRAAQPDAEPTPKRPRKPRVVAQPNSPPMPTTLGSDASSSAGAAVDLPIGDAGDGGLRDAVEHDVRAMEVEVRSLDDDPRRPGSRDLLADLLRLVRENLAWMSGPGIERVQTMLREQIFNADYLDPDFWRGVGMVLQYQIDETRALIERRRRGDYALDSYGMDVEAIEIVKPIAGFIYRSWFRVETSGAATLPADGAALLLSNRGGVLPWDSAMIAMASFEAGPGRLVRSLHEPWLAGVPGVAPALAALGQVPAMPENAARLLSDGELVCAYPEGAQGAARLFRNRYNLSGFAAEPYVRAAIRHGAPIVPVAVVGGEESYPVLANLAPLARLLRAPYLPITPLFPWFGALGLLPLPSKWTISFDAPIATAEYGPDAADDAALVARLAGLVEDTIQALLDRRTAERRSVFLG